MGVLCELIDFFTGNCFIQRHFPQVFRGVFVFSLTSLLTKPLNPGEEVFICLSLFAFPTLMIYLLHWKQVTDYSVEPSANASYFKGMRYFMIIKLHNLIYHCSQKTMKPLVFDWHVRLIINIQDLGRQHHTRTISRRNIIAHRNLLQEDYKFWKSF